MNAKSQFEKLQKRLTKHFVERRKVPALASNLRDKPMKLFQSFLDGGDESALLAGRADKLNAWHFESHAASCLVGGAVDWHDFSCSARYAHAAVKFNEALANLNQGGLELPWRVAVAISTNAICGWKAETNSVALAAYRGLDTPLLDLRHSDEHAAGTLYRHFWFLLHMYCNVRGLALDTSKYSYPSDMSPYAQVLADWRTTDLDKVQTFVTAMANFHLQEARTTAHDEIAEFDTEDRMLFPHEILCWLRMREWVGLVNPVAFDHPLMNQPLAVMPGPDPLPHPETPLLDAVVAKFRDEFPGSFNE